VTTVSTTQRHSSVFVQFYILMYPSTSWWTCCVGRRVC